MPRPYYTTPQFARKRGVKVRTVYKLVAAGAVQCERVGKYLRFDREWTHGYIASLAQASVARQLM